MPSTILPSVANIQLTISFIQTDNQIFHFLVTVIWVTELMNFISIIFMGMKPSSGEMNFYSFAILSSIFYPFCIFQSYSRAWKTPAKSRCENAIFFSDAERSPFTKGLCLNWEEFKCITLPNSEIQFFSIFKSLMKYLSISSCW